jgi:hypothetical protein
MLKFSNQGNDKFLSSWMSMKVFQRSNCMFSRAISCLLVAFNTEKCAELRNSWIGC